MLKILITVLMLFFNTTFAADWISIFKSGNYENLIDSEIIQTERNRESYIYFNYYSLTRRTDPTLRHFYSVYFPAVPVPAL